MTKRCERCGREYNPQVLRACPGCQSPSGAVISPAPAVTAASTAEQRRRSLTQQAITGSQWGKLQEDAGRVSGLLRAVSWVVLGGGALFGLATLMVGLAAGAPLSGLAAAVGAAAYTLVGWVTVMLAAVVSQYIALKAGDEIEQHGSS